MHDFKNIDYLKNGNIRQQAAYKEIIRLHILTDLIEYNPILTGTIPIDIDIAESDLDIICECRNHKEFSNKIIDLYGKQKRFRIKTELYNGIKSTIAEFKGPTFNIEIFGQDIPTKEQNAYKHMMIEYKILKEKGKAFKNEIIKLKQNGMKTEPAFAQLLGIKGNPYNKLLNF